MLEAQKEEVGLPVWGQKAPDFEVLTAQSHQSQMKKLSQNSIATY